MFAEPGHAYVYLVYGIHHAINVVTGPRGHGGAVLLRAGEPLEGLAAMGARRGTDDVRALCRGPGRLAQALEVDRTLDGVDLLRSSCAVARSGPSGSDIGNDVDASDRRDGGRRYPLALGRDRIELGDADPAGLGAGGLGRP